MTAQTTAKTGYEASTEYTLRMVPPAEVSDAKPSDEYERFERLTQRLVNTPKQK